MVLDFVAVDNFDFTRKIVKKIWGEKLVKMLGGIVKIEFLDKKLTFRIVCQNINYFQAVDAALVRDVCFNYIYDKCPVIAGVGPIEGLPDYNEARAQMYWLRI